MKYYYISEERDWADEFSTFGYSVMTEPEFEKNKEEANNLLDCYFDKLTEEEFLSRQADFKKLKEEQGVKWDCEVNNIVNLLPYMYGGYGKDKKFENQWDAPYSAYLARWGEYDHPTYSVGFGTNEEHEIESKEDFWECISIKEITEEEYNTLLKIIGNHGGITCFPVNKY